MANALETGKELEKLRLVAAPIAEIARDRVGPLVRMILHQRFEPAQEGDPRGGVRKRLPGKGFAVGGKVDVEGWKQGESGVVTELEEKRRESNDRSMNASAGTH